MAVILVSSCLLGCECRYKGDSCRNEAVLSLAEKGHTLIGICPEQMGGLPTPRPPAEIVDDKVVANTGADVTAAYQKGAQTALSLATLARAELAVLKAKSPSCGKGRIYDGSFTGVLIPGSGVTASLLEENGIPVYTEEELDRLPI